MKKTIYIPLIFIGLAAFMGNYGSAALAHSISQANVLFESTAQRGAVPRLDAAHGFERAISSPQFATTTVNGQPRTYSCFRVREDKNNFDVIRLAYIDARNFSNGDEITPLQSWNWVSADAFRITPFDTANDQITQGPGPVECAIAGVKDKLFLVIKAGQATSVSGPVMLTILFDPATNQISGSKGRLLDIPGYAGPDVSVPSLARITGGPVSAANYFDAFNGRTILTYACVQEWMANIPNGACYDASGEFRPGFYLQEVYLDGTAVTLGKPVLIFKDEVKSLPTPKQARDAGYTMWRKQNFIASNIGNDALIFSINYNLLAEDSVRPVERDYPGYASLFKIDNVSAILDDASAGTDLVDLSATMPPEQTTWKTSIAADSPWDQGAIWSQAIYIDPFRGNQVFAAYEAWGADYLQPDKTQNAFYPGSLRVWVWANKPESDAYNKSCEVYCRERKYNGSSCLSASVVAPDNPGLHGTEIPHDQIFKEFIAGKDKIISGLYVCSDLGTRHVPAGDLYFRYIPENTRAGDFDYIIPNSSNVPSGTKVKAFSDNACRQEGYAGAVRAEILDTADPDFGYTLDYAANIQIGKDYSLMCSREYSSDKFSLASNVNENVSCDMLCDAKGAGTGIGYRPYYSEVRTPVASTRKYLDSLAVGPDFTLAMQNSFAFIDPDSKYSLPGTVLNCVCGPGRNLRATLAVRKGYLSDDVSPAAPTGLNVQ